MPSLHQLLKAMIDKGASDLHVTVGSAPQLRIDGQLVPLKTSELSPKETRQLCYSVLTDSQKQKFEETNELDLSFGVKGLSRFRGNIFKQRGQVAGVFRAIPMETQSIEELGLPAVVGNFSEKKRGLVLVDPAYRPTGYVTLGRLMSSRRDVRLVDITEPSFRTFRVDEPEGDVAYAFNQYHLISAPVVDETDRLVGVITIDDAMMVLDEENEEDILRLAGVDEESRISDSVRDTTRRRFPWLMDGGPWMFSGVPPPPPCCSAARATAPASRKAPGRLGVPVSSRSGRWSVTS